MRAKSALRYLARRLAAAIVTIGGVVTLVFVLLHALPGDPVDSLLGETADPVDRAELRARLRLDQPLALQYLHFVGDVLDGSLGESFRRPGVTVASRISEVYPATLELATVAMLIAILLAIPLGVIAAARRGGPWDLGATGVALVGQATPRAWLGPLLILLFSIRLRACPLPGESDAGIRDLALPALTLGGALLASLVRITRAGVLEVLGERYVVTARAKGLPERTVLVRHVLRNALLPVTTVGGAQLGALLSGALVTEKVFARPGLGTLFLEGFFTRDIPVVVGCVLVMAATFVVVNLLTDLAYAVIDPRVSP
jgi:peptide/nickel transport system permease protein